MGLWHFLILIGGSLLFLVLFRSETGTATIWSSNPAEAAVDNNLRLLSGVRLIGVFVVFVVLVFGRWLLRWTSHHNR